MNIAVIFAGGTGQRMNTASKPKQFLELHGKPILIYTLENFQNHPQIVGIVLVCLESWIDYCNELLQKYHITKVLKVVPGGNSGQESIFNGLAQKHMKEIYNKYKDKGLVMLGISMDTSKEAWKSAVEADGLPWLQASNLDGISGEVAKKYRISGIPRVFVLDENNRILGETLRYDEIVELIEKAL